MDCIPVNEMGYYYFVLLLLKFTLKKHKCSKRYLDSYSQRDFSSHDHRYSDPTTP